MPGYFIALGIVLLFLFLISAIFSASETVFTATSRAKVDENISDSFWGKKQILKYYDNYEKTLTIILIWNNIVNIGISIIISALFSNLAINESLQILISIAATTPPLIIFGEIYPKIFGRKKPILFLKAFWFFITFFYYFLFPLAALMTKFVKKISVTNTENELKKIILQAHQEDVLEKDESDLAIRALEFDSFTTAKHFTKLEDVVFVKYEDSLESIKEVIIDSNFSRIPVWKDDNFVGILLSKDILHLDKFDINDHIIKTPLLLSTSLIKTNYEILKKSKSHLGFVVDSNKSQKIVGILTFEDILECLLGPIYDEYDYRDDLDFYQISPNQITTKAETSILTINKILAVNLPVNFKNLNQWLLSQSSKKKLVLGAKFYFDWPTYKLEFEIIDKSANTIELKITKNEFQQKS
ncbi:CNNM domain-containing protein [Mesomycoplasma ovipneumoniae]|uniref:CNNM domain-containing protein n=1 Tax=Mesomycoplasma ovipneumoniae TaxID=29562 RepID=UPI00311AE30F